LLPAAVEVTIPEFTTVLATLISAVDLPKNDQILAIVAGFDAYLAIQLKARIQLDIEVLLSAPLIRTEIVRPNLRTPAELPIQIPPMWEPCPQVSFEQVLLVGLHNTKLPASVSIPGIARPPLSMCVSKIPESTTYTLVINPSLTLYELSNPLLASMRSKFHGTKSVGGSTVVIFWSELALLSTSHV
jgi:hypothetical protein